MKQNEETQKLAVGADRAAAVQELYEERPGVHGVTLSSADRTILRSMEPIVDAIARIFGANCEVLLHSLEDLSNSVVKIANGHVTGRDVGAPVTDLAMRVMRDARTSQTDVVGPYTTKTKDGRTLRSVTSVVRGITGRPIGIVCVNLDMSAPLIDVVSDLLRETLSAGTGESPENFVTSSEELVHRSVGEVLRTIGSERKLSPVAKNKLIVGELLDRGIFDIRGAVEHVAKEMGLSKYTIYNYLRELRQE